MPSYSIVSPYQGTPLNDVARISFSRTAEVLPGVRWIFALPEGTDLSELRSVCGDRIEARFFSPEFFVSKRSAQLFYMHPEFFGAFSDFDFILVHQPDVYVFEDQIEHWMEFMADGKFDYIGAPWWDHEWLRFARNPLARLPWHWVLRNRVGSGGFSIRNPRRCAEISRLHFSLIKRLAAFVPEDIWWCQLADIVGSPLRRPPPEIAAQFCFETQCSRNFELTVHSLPFAAHGWNRHDWDFWSDRITEAAAVYRGLAARGVRPLL